MRYEIAVLLRALDEYYSRTGGYHPVDTATMSAAIEETKAAYSSNLQTAHEETLVEIIHARKIIYLATALSDYDRGVAVALSTLRFREQQEDDREMPRPAFHITWLDERYKLLNLYGQLLDEEKDAMFQLALDALRARGVLPPPQGEQEEALPQKAPELLNLQAAIVLSVTNKAKVVKDVRTIVVERHSTAPFDLYYLLWCVADGAILDNFGTSDLSILNRWLTDHGLSSEDRLWKPM